jgi:hydroxysqualene dehydroxylase
MAHGAAHSERESMKEGRKSAAPDGRNIGMSPPHAAAPAAPSVATAGPVVVVGGGWAGLAAAVELTRQGRAVTLVESARQLGGRARCTRFGALRVDNGQHLVLGANHQLLGLLRTLGVDEAAVFRRQPLRLWMKRPHARDVRLRTPAAPAPLHLLIGLLGAGGLRLGEKLRALQFWERMRARGFELAQDLSVAALLEQHGQPEPLVQAVWAPLCLASLNTPPPLASAQVFLRVLRESLAGARHCSDLLVPRVDLGTALPGPALDYIERHGGKVILGRRVVGLETQGEAVAGVLCTDGRLAAADVVLAVSPVACRRLLSPHPRLRAIAAQVAGLRAEPICTVYLQYPPDTRLPFDMIGLLGGTGQWVFDRATCGQDGLMSVVISAGGPHMELSNAALAERVAAELAAAFPRWARPERSLVIREKRATFACRVGVDALRPDCATPMRGLWLAGDYTATGLPSTLEGAVRSGIECAHVLLHGATSGAAAPMQALQAAAVAVN